MRRIHGRTVLANGTKPFRFRVRAANRLDPCEVVLTTAYNRIVKMVHKYRITARVNSHMIVLRLPEMWICTLKAEKYADNRHWAVLTVEWTGIDPSLSQFDVIKTDFLGSDAYFTLNFVPAHAKRAVIINCIGDWFMPGKPENQ